MKKKMNHYIIKIMLCSIICIFISSCDKENLEDIEAQNATIILPDLNIPDPDDPNNPDGTPATKFAKKISIFLQRCFQKNKYYLYYAQ